MSTRKQVRERMAVLFAGQGFNQVNAYAPLDLQGMTKVLNIYSDKSRHDVLGANFSNNFYALFLDVFIKRVSGENSEDDLDDMHEVVRSVITTNIGDSVWSHLDLSGDSDAFFAEVAGVPYRVERHSVLVKVSS